MQSIILKPDLQKGSSPERKLTSHPHDCTATNGAGNTCVREGAHPPLCNVSFRSNGKHPCRSGCGRGGFLSEKTVGNRAGPL